ncbi:MAG: 50S ribosomal protein L15 [Candidatus Pacebacteria bacterium]|nr:50S ribosomal protein L15 [Candidatus Paceibacterota bacterium]
MSLLNKLASIRKSLPKRVGRGYGSGKGGHNSGRGQKGQNSRRGGGVAIWFEGGQLPLIKRMPMQRGKSKLKVVRPTAQLTLTELSNVSADVVTLDTLKLEKVIDGRFKKAKVIASGEITRKVTVEGLLVTEGAKAAIEKAGGKVV